MAASTTPSLKTDIPLLRGPNGSYKWPIYDEEENRLTEMLGVDFKTFDIGGTFVMQPPLRCQQCGKRSGLDDFVHEALADGIHSKEFILHILGSEHIRASPAHRLRCMNCNIYFRHAPQSKLTNSWSPVSTRINSTDPNTVKDEVALFGWAETFDWTYDVKERDQDDVALFGWAETFDWTYDVKERDQDDVALFGWAKTFDWRYDIKERGQDANEY